MDNSQLRTAGGESFTGAIEPAAEALEVSVAELLGSVPQTGRRKLGPASQLELRMERIKRLPRKEQEFALCFLDTVLERAEQE